MVFINDWGSPWYQIHIEWIHHSGWTLIFSHRPIVPLEPGVLNLHSHIHNSIAPELGAMHVNLCVEMREYRPWRLKDILDSRVPPLVLANNGVVS